MLDENFNESFFTKDIKIEETKAPDSFFEKQSFDHSHMDHSNFFDGAYQDFANINEPSKLPTPTLKKYNIKTKSDWKEWLRKNHVDKGGDKAECVKVIEEGTEYFK